MLLPLLFIYPLVKWGLKETARFREVFLFGIPLLNLYALTRWFRPLPGVEKKPFYVFVALFAYFQLSALSSFYFADRWIAVLNLILFLAAFCCEYLICRGPFRKTREFVRSAYPDDFKPAGIGIKENIFLLPRLYRKKDYLFEVKILASVFCAVLLSVFSFILLIYCSGLILEPVQRSRARTAGIPTSPQEYLRKYKQPKPPYVKPFLETLPEINWERGADFSGVLFGKNIPPESIAGNRRFLENNQEVLRKMPELLKYNSFSADPLEPVLDPGLADLLRAADYGAALQDDKKVLKLNASLYRRLLRLRLLSEARYRAFVLFRLNKTETDLPFLKDQLTVFKAMEAEAPNSFTKRWDRNMLAADHSYRAAFPFFMVPMVRAAHWSMQKKRYGLEWFYREAYEHTAGEKESPLDFRWHTLYSRFADYYAYPALESHVVTYSGFLASCRTVKTLIAVEMYRKKYKRLPAKLEQLIPDFLSSIPLDPFDGRPLRYRHGKLDVKFDDFGGKSGYECSIEKRDAIRVYSIGRNLRDENGADWRIGNSYADDISATLLLPEAKRISRREPAPGQSGPRNADPKPDA